MNQATGANDTPLGTPVRMSPVNDSSVVEGDSGQRKPPSENPKKRKMETEILEPVKKKKKKTAEAQETAGDNITEVGAITESLPQVTDFQRTKVRNLIGMHCQPSAKTIAERKCYARGGPTDEEEAKGGGGEG